MNISSFYLFKNCATLFLSVKIMSESGLAFPLAHLESNRQSMAWEAVIPKRNNIISILCNYVCLQSLKSNKIHLNNLATILKSVLRLNIITSNDCFIGEVIALLFIVLQMKF